MTETDPHRAGQTDETGRTLCGAKKKDGNPCAASPKKGFTRCRRHGGNSPQAKRKAQERNTKAKAEEQLRSLGYLENAPNIDPTEALLRLVSDKAREVAWLRTMVDQVTSDQHADDGPSAPKALVWGKTKHEEGVGPLGPVDKEDYAADLNIWVRWLHTAEEQLAKYATSALRAGVEQRQVEIREQEALVFVGAIHNILNNLNLSTDQRALIPEVVPAALREIEGQAA